MDGQAHHVLEGDRGSALLEGGHPLAELEDRKDDAVDLAGHRTSHLVLVEDAGLHEGIAEPALPPFLVEERGDARELLVGDPR